MMRILVIFAVLVPAAFVLMWLVRAKWQARHLDHAQERKRLRTEIDLADEESEILDLSNELSVRRRKLDARREHEVEGPPSGGSSEGAS